MVDSTVNLDNSVRGNSNGQQSQGQFSTTSSLASSRTGKTGRSFRYRGRMQAAKAMNQLSRVDEARKNGTNGSHPNDPRANLASQKKFHSLNHQRGRKPLYISIIVLLAYLSLGTLVYTLWIEEWNIIDSLYFTVATLTTIGYNNDYTAGNGISNDGVRAFTIFYIIFGAFIMGGIFFGFLFDSLFTSFEQISKESKALTSDYFIARLDYAGSVAATLRNGNNGGGGDSRHDRDEVAVNTMYGLEDHELILLQEESTNFKSDFCKTFCKTIPLMVALIVPPLIMGYDEQWSVLSSLYFTVVTASTGKNYMCWYQCACNTLNEPLFVFFILAMHTHFYLPFKYFNHNNKTKQTTVGYNDIVPKNTYMKLIAVFYMPICIYVMARTFSKLTIVYLRHKSKATEQEYYNRNLSDTDFESMDIEENEGSVGYDEFLVFMLVAMGKVSPEDIQKMEELYQRLDADIDGVLRVEDLFSMAYGNGSGNGNGNATRDSDSEM
jgi:hypothetical protein